MKNDKKVILASSSPRRKELLHKIVDDFEIISPICNEIEDSNPTLTALNNAVLKANAINADKDKIVVACDTLVACDGKIYGKPYTVNAAISMLKELCGKWHDVISGVCILCDGQNYSYTEKSRVKFFPLTDEEITAYIDKFLPLDKAGSYGIQDGVVVEKYEGEIENIIGLPIKKLRDVLRRYINVKG